ncbi:Histone-like transcription factor (CBF/NF-Y) and archaeal histone [Popillia japonica]|uniref:Histone-like transcription factor (CBF/NF-Y) and archaeal histone n=1 Tax=Popillia japonica TaxID=7064 RepID=A0AAW1LDN7_POPJA
MTHLPQSRVRTIMKTADGADNIGKEAVFLSTRATEMFIKLLVKEGYRNTNCAKKLTYNNLVNVIHNTSRFEFLEIVIPKKITVRQYKELIAKSENPQRDKESSSDERSIL